MGCPLRGHHCRQGRTPPEAAKGPRPEPTRTPRVSHKNHGPYREKPIQPRSRQHAKTGEPAGGAHDPLHHARKMSAQLSEMIDNLRRDIDQVDEPQFKAMFETAQRSWVGW
jgi:hypothetical protein